VRIEDFAQPRALAAHVCKTANLRCKRKTPPVWRSLFSPAVRAHHREHGACSMGVVRAADPALADAVVALAKRYGYNDPRVCNLGA